MTHKICPSFRFTKFNDRNNIESSVLLDFVLNKKQQKQQQTK